MNIKTCKPCMGKARLNICKLDKKTNSRHRFCPLGAYSLFWKCKNMNYKVKWWQYWG